MVAPERIRDFLSERDRADLWDSMLVVASTRRTPEDVESWLIHCAEVWAHRQGSKVDRPANREVLDWVIIEAHRRAPEEFRAGCAKAVAVMADHVGKPQARYRDKTEPRRTVPVLARDAVTRAAVAPLAEAMAPLHAQLQPAAKTLGADVLWVAAEPPDPSAPQHPSVVRVVLYDDEGY